MLAKTLQAASFCPRNVYISIYIYIIIIVIVIVIVIIIIIIIIINIFHTIHMFFLVPSFQRGLAMDANSQFVNVTNKTFDFTYKYISDLENLG